MRRDLPEGFKDAALLCWLCFILSFAYLLARQGVKEHWPLLRWVVSIYMGSMLAFPFFMLAYSRWFKGQR